MPTNQQIVTDHLPTIESVELTGISKAYLKIIYLNALMVFIVPFIVLILTFFVFNTDTTLIFFWIFLSVLIIFFASYLTIAILGFSKRRYAIRELDVIYSSGLIFYKLTTVPFVRIQHIEISKSFLARKFDLATLHIYTAGASGSDLVIKGLPSDVAEKLNAFLSSKINEQL